MISIFLCTLGFMFCRQVCSRVRTHLGASSSQAMYSAAFRVIAHLGRPALLLDLFERMRKGTDVEIICFLLAMIRNYVFVRDDQNALAL